MIIMMIGVPGVMTGESRLGAGMTVGMITNEAVGHHPGMIMIEAVGHHPGMITSKAVGHRPGMITSEGVDRRPGMIIGAHHRHTAHQNHGSNPW